MGAAISEIKPATQSMQTASARNQAERANSKPATTQRSAHHQRLAKGAVQHGGAEVAVVLKEAPPAADPQLLGRALALNVDGHRIHLGAVWCWVRVGGVGLGLRGVEGFDS